MSYSQRNSNKQHIRRRKSVSRGSCCLNNPDLCIPFKEVSKFYNPWLPLLYLLRRLVHHHQHLLKLASPQGYTMAWLEQWILWCPINSVPCGITLLVSLRFPSKLNDIESSFFLGPKTIFFWSPLFKWVSKILYNHNWTLSVLKHHTYYWHKSQTLQRYTWSILLPHCPLLFYKNLMKSKCKKRIWVAQGTILLEKNYKLELGVEGVFPELWWST